MHPSRYRPQALARGQAEHRVPSVARMDRQIRVYPDRPRAISHAACAYQPLGASRVTLWRNQAENASKYLKKGSPVYIEGRLSQEEWQDRDGNTRFTLAVQATEMHFLGSGARNDDFSGDNETPQFAGPANANSTSSGSSSAGAAPAAADDDIPF